ncbi:MAG: YwaF family protein [Clostridia bacterium]|nr:YwaF family protein [Clostridia bacterium]
MIISPFNPVFFALIGTIAAIVIGSYFIFRKASEKTKTIFILSLCAFNFILYIVYKVTLPFDEEYVAMSDTANPIFDALPLHLCNINLFLIPIAVLTKNKYIAGFSFFVAPLAAIMPMIFPEPEFTGFSLTLMRMAGYYYTHALIIICGLCLCTLGFFRPTFKVVPGTLVTFVLLSIAIHGVNTLLRLTGIYPDANYFFTYDAGGVSALMIFREIIDLPYLYELPAIPILAVYMVLICSITAIVDKIKKSKQTSR